MAALALPAWTVHPLGMPPANQIPLEEASIDGPLTLRWLLESEECGEFNAHRIARLGVEQAAAPYRRVRVRPAGSFFLATLEGEGRILLDGKWQRVTAGSLFMAPPRVLNAFYAVPGKPWHFSWLRYSEPNYVRPLVGADSPVRAASGGQDLARSIDGLRAEWEGARDPRILHHWVSLVHALARRGAQPPALDDRLATLWARVAGSLGHPWTLESLGAEVHGSVEYLRRRCLKELGRSPMQHLTYMRMQRAQTLLETTQETVESIAREVGFSDGLVFSRAFKRWIGRSPTEYRHGR
jgi:AraC-like DNA-binding protein